MTDENPLSKSAQLERSAGKRYYCDTTGQYKGRCPCPSCRGRRSRGKGKRGERKARRGVEKAIGVRLVTNLAQAAVGEEAFSGPVRLEIKSGGRFANPVGLRFQKMEAQSDGGKATGDPRPFMGVVIPDDWGEDGVVLIRLTKLREVLEALSE